MQNMEISIKWNVCRVCLSEERQNHVAKYVPIDTKTAKQIYDITGVQVEMSDNLPDKICHKCLLLLKYAYHFSTTCRNSDEYLQSVIQKTKSATSMLKLDKRRERTIELMDAIFNEDGELISATEVDEREGAPMEESLAAPRKIQEVIGDGEELNKKYNPHHFKSSENISRILKLETQKLKTEVNNRSYVPEQGKSKIVENKSMETTEKDENKDIYPEQKSLTEEFIEEYEENDLDEFYGNDANKKGTSECSIEEDGYMDDGEGEHDGEEEHVDALEIANVQNDYNVKDENKINETGDTEDIDRQHEKDKTPTNSEDEPETGAEEFYYVIEEPVIKLEESSNSTTNVFVDNDGDTEAEATMQLMEDIAEVGSHDDDGEGAPAAESDENPAAPRSLISLEEYLLDDSDNEDISQKIPLLKGGQTSKSATKTAIKEMERDRRSLSHARKKAGNGFVYICDVCGNHFTNRSLKNYHMRMHRNEKNFECELCFKRFAAACNLTAHMRIHTGEKPYECKYCLRRFTDRSTHIKHERIHTNEKPFQCNTCGKSFALSTTLRTHEKVHTNEKPFKCTPCNKSFKLPHQLKSHMHTNQHKNIANELGLLDPRYEKCN